MRENARGGRGGIEREEEGEGGGVKGAWGGRMREGEREKKSG